MCACGTTGWVHLAKEDALEDRGDEPPPSIPPPINPIVTHQQRSITMPYVDLAVLQKGNIQIPELAATG